MENVDLVGIQVKKYLEIKIAPDNVIAQSILEEIFVAIGFPFRFVQQWQNPLLKISCGEDGSRADLIIPQLNPQIWDRVQPQLATVNNIQILYIENQPNSLLEVKRLKYDLLGNYYYLLTGKNPVRDDIAAILRKTPLINYQINYVREVIQELLRNRNLDLTPLPVWPDNKEFCVVLSHDVDMVTARSCRNAGYYFNFFRSKKINLRRRIVNLLKFFHQICGSLINNLLQRTDALWNFEEWLKLEDACGVRSTFYFASGINNIEDRDPPYSYTEQIIFRGKTCSVTNLMKTLVQEGWEVGLHGSCASHQSLECLQKEKTLLERTIGRKISGIRQHCLLFDKDITPVLHCQAGFVYDSSIGFNREVGFKNSLGLPFRLLNHDHLMKIYEIPLIVQDCALFDFKKYTSDRALNESLKLVEITEDVQGLICFLWHPGTYDGRKWKKWLRVYDSLLRHLVKKNAYISTANEVVAYWQERRSNLLG